MISVMGIIFYVSHQPGDFARLPPIIGLDKLIHVLVYFILACTFLFGLGQYSKRENQFLVTAMAVVLCLLYGISDELHQSFIPGRIASIWDVLADGLGGLLAGVVWSRQKVFDLRNEE